MTETKTSRPHLLHLDSSASRSSHSRAVAAAFADRWRAGHPDGIYTYRDLVANPIPHINEGRVELVENAVRAGVDAIADLPSAATTPAARASLDVAMPLIDELLAASTLLISAPMYNFSVPASLKAWIDQISFPFLPLAGRRVVVATARGGAYGPESPRAEFEFQEAYLRALFRFFNVNDVEFLNTELTLASVAPAMAELRGLHESSRSAALDGARALGERVEAVA